MSLNSKNKLKHIAKILSRDLRKRQTEAESKLWDMLRGRQFANYKFLRQHPVFYDFNGKESFVIADFYCAEKKLIIELDGEYHKYRLNKDIKRSDILRSMRYRVIRFNNNEIEKSIERVLAEIKLELVD